MKPSEKRVVTIYVVLSLVVIVILSILLARKKKDEENYNYKQCVCTEKDGGRGRVCQNTEAVWDAYINGVNENSNKISNPNWGTISPGDLDFPQMKGCSEPKRWTAWDFIDFAT